jgi:TonB family protein
MATVTTSEFVKTREYTASFSMIEHKGIVTRLHEEASLAVGDFTRDPRGFIREIFSGESKDLQRSKRLRMGLAFGLVFQIVVITAIAVAGWRHATSLTKSEKPEHKVEIINLHNPNSTPEKRKESPTNGDPSSNIPAPPKGDKNAGGSPGGGGQDNPAPARHGVLPQYIPNSPIIAPTAPDSKNPNLPVSPTLQGFETPPLPPDATIGLPNGDPKSNAGGPGKNGGIGSGEGPGAGNNKGSGGGNNPDGKGPGGGDRTGPPGTPNGSITPTGPLDYAPFSRMPDTTGIVWIRRVRPIITPEAAADKIHGYVLLEATFNADGTITDIRVRQSLASMDNAAIESLQKAKFRPATIKGVPVTLRRVPVKVNVNLDL